ncbi:hypothetical protein ABW20_dc0100989 [Dactylellina cionopaga]|nr:hypothetical protein ABW20_dc0100989 [Dactylellina cionopaga]
MDPPFCPPSSCRSWISKVFNINANRRSPACDDTPSRQFHLISPTNPSRVWDTSLFCDPALISFRQRWLAENPGTVPPGFPQADPDSIPHSRLLGPRPARRILPPKPEGPVTLLPSPFFGDQDEDEDDDCFLNFTHETFHRYLGSRTDTSPSQSATIALNRALLPPSPSSLSDINNITSNHTNPMSTSNAFSATHRPFNSSFAGSTISTASTPNRKRHLSRLERENPDIDPDILAIIDPNKPIGEQIAKIKAASKQSSSSSPSGTPAVGDAFRKSLPIMPFGASGSVKSFGSSTMSASQGRRQTSGQLGKGDDGAIAAMKRKAAEDRLHRQRRHSLSRTSYAGSTQSFNGDLKQSRVSNSSFGISRIGLHSSTGSARPLSASSNRMLPPPPVAVTEQGSPVPNRFHNLTYVQSILAKKEASQGSRGSTPDTAGLDSPYASIAARARGMLAENTKEIQAERDARRKREAMKQEMERERARRDARMEAVAKLVKEEEELLKREEEELLTTTNRKRDAGGTLRYSPDVIVNNTVHPYGKSPKDNPRKRSPSADLTPAKDQPIKRARSSEQDDGVANEWRPKLTDRKLMPPPPTPTPRTATQSSTNGSSISLLFSPTSTQDATPPTPYSNSWVAEKNLSGFEQSFSEHDPTSFHSAKASFGAPGSYSLELLGEDDNDNDDDDDMNGDITGLQDTVEDEGRELNHSEEPMIGQPVSAMQMSTHIPLAAAPIIRDFAYENNGDDNDEDHRGSDTDPDEVDDEEDDEEETELKEKKEIKNSKPVVIDLLDSDDEEDEEDDASDAAGTSEEPDYNEEEADDEENDYDEESDDEEGSDEEEDGSEAEFDENTQEGFYLNDEANKEKAVIEVYSSPAPLDAIELEAPTAGLNGSPTAIPDSFTVQSEETRNAAQDNSEQKAENIDAALLAADHSSPGNHTSEEQVWIRREDGRLIRSSSPELVQLDPASQQTSQNKVTDTRTDDVEDDEMGNAALAVDPALMSSGLGIAPSIPTAVHTH